MCARGAPMEPYPPLCVVIAEIVDFSDRFFFDGWTANHRRSGIARKIKIIFTSRASGTANENRKAVLETFVSTHDLKAAHFNATLAFEEHGSC